MIRNQMKCEERTQVLRWVTKVQRENKVPLENADCLEDIAELQNRIIISYGSYAHSEME